MDTLKAWLALHLTPGLGAVGCKRLVDFFGSPAEALEAGSRGLAQAKGLKKTAREYLAGPAPRARADKEMARAAKVGVTLLCPDDPGYPALLAAIHAPPPILYLKGDASLLNTPCLAMVGSRAATTYGEKVAASLAADLVEKEVTVVSGMALGIDTAAHYGALGANGPTIAVLGCGVDVLYPPQNGKLYERLAGQGLIVSEYPMGTRPDGYRFPARNRIISGLSRGVVVVEAGLKSGSLITARLALEEGREVFAVPGRVDSPKSFGAHKLLQEGAKLVHTLDDILEELPPFQEPGQTVEPSTAAPLTAPVTSSSKAQRPEPEVELAQEEEAVFRLLDVYPQTVDEIIITSGLSAAKINEVLLLLEIKGLVEVSPGQQYNLKATSHRTKE